MYIGANGRDPNCERLIHPSRADLGDEPHLAVARKIEVHDESTKVDLEGAAGKTLTRHDILLS
jgi:hypothetical protein